MGRFLRRREYLLACTAIALIACSGDDSSPGGSSGHSGDSSSGSGGTGTASGGSVGSGGAATGGFGGGGTDGSGGSQDNDGGGTGGSADTDSGATGGSAGSPIGDGSTTCVYKDDPSFCACMGWNCGGTNIKDATGALRTVYCGQCSGGTYCQSTPTYGVGVGTCGGTNPLVYAWQKQKIDMLVAMGENDNTKVNYDYAQDIKDGRGYTVGKVGFTTGTGDFIIVAECYNDLKPGNVLSKYWGHRDASGKAIDGLIYYEEQYAATGMNQGSTKLIDSLKGTSTFVKDCATAAQQDQEYRTCQDSMADALYLATALQHAQEKGLHGVLTIGFLYDTELNFGDEDDSPTVLGAKSVIKKADADYGSGLPLDFTGKPWEESKWLGYLIKERTIVMSKDNTWNQDMDQDATWEAARRLHTAKTNNPESGTDLSMEYDIISQYKAGTKSAGTPCWPTELSSTIDSQSSIFKIGLNEAASATDQTKWIATSASGGNAYAACPVNPTP